MNSRGNETNIKVNPKFEALSRMGGFIGESAKKDIIESASLTIKRELAEYYDELDDVNELSKIITSSKNAYDAYYKLLKNNASVLLEFTDWEIRKSIELFKNNEVDTKELWSTISAGYHFKNEISHMTIVEQFVAYKYFVLKNSPQEIANPKCLNCDVRYINLILKKTENQLNSKAKEGFELVKLLSQDN